MSSRYVIPRNTLAWASAILTFAVSLPSISNGAQVIQYGDAAQGPVNTTLIISLVNNDVGTIYQSATLDLEALLSSVADWISQHSTDVNFAGKTHAQIFSQMFFVAGGEVSTGWGAIPNGTTLQMTHNAGDPDSDYSVWYSSSYNGGGQDTMNLYCTLPNSALNGNNLTTTTNLAGNVLVGTDTSLTTHHASAYSYKVLEPPSTNLTILDISALLAGTIINGSPVSNAAIQIATKVNPTGTVYALQYADSLNQTNWGIISSTNRATTNETDLVYDLAPSPSNRYYRLGIP